MTKYNLIFTVFIVVNLFIAVLTTANAGVDNNLSVGYSQLSLVVKDTKIPSPSALTVKYGFSLLKDIKPYIGTGLAYVLPADATASGNPTKIKTGLAGTAGIKIDLGISSSLKIDYKYLHLNSNQTEVNNSTSPQSIGVGFEIKF
jgi:outer membrane protein W